MRETENFYKAPKNSVEFQSNKEFYGVGNYVKILWFLMIINVLWLGATSCMCGHFSREVLWGSVPSFVIGSCLFFFIHRRIRKKISMDYLCSIVAVAFLTWFFGVTLTDVLWSGHSHVLNRL